MRKSREGLFERVMATTVVSFALLVLVVIGGAITDKTSPFMEAPWFVVAALIGIVLLGALICAMTIYKLWEDY